MIQFQTWKIVVVLGVCLLGMAFAAPNLLTVQQAEELPDWLPHITEPGIMRNPCRPQ